MDKRFALIDVDGHYRYPYKKQERSTGRYGFVIGKDRHGKGEYTESLERVIKAVVLEGMGGRMKAEGVPGKAGNTVSLHAEREIVDYWLSPDLQHLVGGAKYRPVNDVAFDSLATASHSIAPTRSSISSVDQLLEGNASQEATELLNDLAALTREVLDVTERDILTKARIGQGKFRTDLVASWRNGETCALTGLSVPEMLIASHIKPWRACTNEERLDPMNGLLLGAHVDKLFDRHLLSFEECQTGFKSVLHPRIRQDVTKLGLTNGMTLDTSNLGVSDKDRFRYYMGEHLTRYKAVVKRDESKEGLHKSVLAKAVG